MSTAHWSEDFVEHLRSVHFALALLSATLIVLAVPPDDKLSRALTQATQMQDLQRRWPAIRTNLLFDASRKGKLAYEKDYFVHITGGEKIGGSMIYNLHAILEANGELGRYVFIGPMNDAPQTIGEFQTWWDTLNHDGLKLRVVDLAGDAADDHSHAICLSQLLSSETDAPSTESAVVDSSQCEEMGPLPNVMVSMLTVAEGRVYLQYPLVAGIRAPPRRSACSP